MALKGIKISEYAHGLLVEIQNAGRKASKTESKPTQADIVDPLIEKAYQRIVKDRPASTTRAKI